MTGRHEEAITTLQHALSHHPLDQGLGVHLGLASSYGELGRMEEARATVAAVLKINPNWSLDVWKQRALQQDPAVLESTITALRKAGLK